MMKSTIKIIAVLLALLSFASCHKDMEFGNEKPEVGEVEVTSASNQTNFTWKVAYSGKFQTGVEISDNEALTDSRIVEGTKDGEIYKASVSSLEASRKYYYRIVVWNKLLRQEGEVKSFTTAVPEYTIAVAVHPEEGGSVTGGGGYTANSTCTVKAIANEGYNFINWTENNMQVSGEAEYTFTVTGNRNLVANFSSQAYIIQVEIDPEEGGTVDGAGGYNLNDECTLIATANEGYEFVNWMKEGEEISTEPSITITVIESATYVAHFQKKSYTIEVTANPVEGGTVSGGGIYSYGDLCVVTAATNEGYTFVNWTENGGQVSGYAEYTFTVAGNRQLVANFTSQAYLIQVQIDPEEDGSVTGAGGYDYGQECTLKATANDGYDFVNWTKEDGTEVSINATYRFTVTESVTYVAHFQKQTYTIEVSANPEEGGTVSGGGTFNYGENCALTATANMGYDFDHWQDGNTDNPRTIMVTGNATYEAYFTSQTYTITTQSSPSDGGTVSGGGNYTYGQNCTLTATANTGYDFDHWTKNGTNINGGATISFAVTENATYVAYFIPQTYTITTQSIPSNGGSISGGGDYAYGQNCTLTATTNAGYDFDHWTKNGSTISGGATINFTVTSNATYVAYFTPRAYTITTQSNPSNGGSVSGGGNYTYGQNCTLTATANTGYDFDHWTKNGSTISGGTTINFTVTENATYVAFFTSLVLTVTTSQVTNITQTTATGGGNVINDGGATVTERGICWSTNHNPTISGNHASNGTGTGSYTVNMTGLNSGTTYYVRAYAINSQDTSYGNEVSFTTNGSAGGHDYVDLGLPSGLLWATYNVGAACPEDNGDYFAWGETQSKSVFNWSTYQYCMGNYLMLTKYCSNSTYGYNGFTDNLTVLEPSDDAATVNWGSGWRMPTKEEWEELINNTTFSTEITQNGVRGVLFTANNGNSIFMPSAGCLHGTTLYEEHSGYYWSSSLYSGSPDRAWYLDFSLGNPSMHRGNSRDYGQLVRPVRSSSQN